MQNCERISHYTESEVLKEFLTDHFGFTDSILQSYRFFKIDDNKTLFLSNQFDVEACDTITQIGLPAYKGYFPRGYVTNAFIYRFGHLATKNVINVDLCHLPKLLIREGIDIELSGPHSGHQVVKSGHKILGRGWLRNGRLFLEAPKIWKQNLL